MGRGDSSSHRHSGFRIDVDVRRVRRVTHWATDITRADCGGLCAGHTLLPAQPDLPAAPAPQSVARRIDRREHVAIAPTRGGLDIIGLDGSVDRVSGLAGHLHDSWREFVVATHETE